MANQHDEKILSLIRAGSNTEQAYRMLMDTYQLPLYRHIRRLVHTHEDAGDILQNTFIKVFRNISKFEERSGLYTWIFKIASNEAYSYVKKNNRTAAFFDRSESDQNLANKAFMTSQINGEQIKEMLDSALGTLPVKQKQVFSLRYFEEMDYRQMSEILDTSEGALKASFHHAVKKIEHYFKSSNIF